METERKKYVQTYEEQVTMYEKQIAAQRQHLCNLEGQLDEIENNKTITVQEMSASIERCDELERCLGDFQARQQHKLVELNAGVRARFDQLERQRNQLIVQIEEYYDQIEHLQGRSESLSEQFGRLSEERARLGRESDLCEQAERQLEGLLKNQQNAAAQLEETQKCCRQYREMSVLVKQEYQLEFADQEQRACECATLEAAAYDLAGRVWALERVDDALKLLYE